MPFRFLENVAIADAAYEAWGNSREELFCEAARAMMEIVVDTSTVGKRERRDIHIARDDLEGLLYAFLSEIIFLKDTDDILFSDFAVRIGNGTPLTLDAQIYGESLDRKRDGLRQDIKAVTYYLFSIREEGSTWKATVVIDL